jgi:SAM-dependent methyltransferase
MDASAGALEEARRAARAENASALEFVRADLNALDLPRDAFDVVLMNMSLHHVRNLEGTLDAVQGALKPGGILIANEFVGPSQFQFTDLQLAVSAAVLEVLPERWRMDRDTGRPKTRYVRQPRAHWNEVDPSEAIRSDEIVPEVLKRFELLARRDYGGTLLHLALEHVVHNFEAGDERDVAAIRLMGLLEQLLIDHGVLESDFTLLALRKGPPGTMAAPKERMPGVEIERQKARASVLEGENADLRARLERTEGSRVWRIAQALRGLVGRRW